MTEATSSREVVIVNEKGLHARASAKFVRCVARFDAEVSVRRDGESVSGASIMGLMMLGAATHTRLILEARGKDRDAVLDALETLIASGFDENA